MNVRSTGRIVAGVLFTLVAGVIFVAVRNQQAPSGAGATGPGAPGDSGKSGPLQAPEEAIRRPGMLSAADRGTWTRVDPVTGEIESRLTWEHLTPLPEGWFELEKPEAWLFVGGKPRVQSVAPKGKVLWRGRDELPESGELTGGVVIRVFPQEASSKATPDVLPGPQASLYHATIDTLRFQQALSQIDSDDPLVVEGPGLKVESTGVVLRISQVSRRLQYFRTLGKLATINPAELQKGMAAVGTAQPTGAANEAARPPSAAPAPTVLDSYLSTFEGGVRLAQGARSIQSDKAELFTRLANGKLPDGAIAPLKPAAKDGGAALAGSSATAPASSAPALPPASETITLAWAGPLEVKLADPPSPGAPDEKEMVRLAFRSARFGGVTLADTGADLSVTAAAIEYGATTRSLHLRASDLPAAPGGSTHKQGDGARIVAKLPDGATLDCGDIDLNLTTGVGSITGAGSTKVARQGQEPAGVSWTGRCDYVIDTSDGPVGSTRAILPKEITLSDGVQATSPDGAASAGIARVFFSAMPADAAHPQRRAALSRIVLRDRASASAADHSLLSGDELVVTFSSAAGSTGAEGSNVIGKSVPELVSAKGNARAEQNGESISASSLNARLARDGANKSRVAKFDADGGVVYTGRDGVETHSDTLTADVLKRVVDLVGKPAIITRHEPSVGAAGGPSAPGAVETLSSERIRLDGIARSLSIDGPGEVVYTLPEAGAGGQAAEGPSRDEKLVLKWKKSLAYDDKAGRADFVGLVEVDARRGVTDRDTGRADHVVVAITPADSAGTDRGRRVLERVELIGPEAAGEAGWAQAQARRYVAGEGPALGKLEGMVDLRGATITTQPTERGMSIPGPGALVIEDLRSLETPGEGAAAPQSPDAPATPDVKAFNSRGTTVLQWQGELIAPPSASETLLQVKKEVRIRHLPPGAQTAMVLNCDEVTATIDWQTPSAPADAAAPKPAAQEPKLKRIEATGNIFIMAMQTKVKGSGLSYDAAANEVRISGSGDSKATVLDEKTGVTATADVVVLNPVTGEWKTQGAGTVATPR